MTLHSHTPLKRTTPLRPNGKTVAKDMTASRKVRVRDGGRCQFERKCGQAWYKCGEFGSDASHAAYPRRECRPIHDDPDFMIWACRPCHNVNDGLGNADGRTVRVPLVAFARARVRMIQAVADGEMSTLPPERFQVERK